MEMIIMIKKYLVRYLILIHSNTRNIEEYYFCNKREMLEFANDNLRNKSVNIIKFKLIGEKIG